MTEPVQGGDTGASQPLAGAPPSPVGKASPRRRFLTQGLAGGSVALLATTHRALAGSCTTARTYSGYTSFVTSKKKSKKKTTSANPGNYHCGYSPSYWSGTSSWPSGCKPTDKFTSHFGSSFYPSGGGLNKNSTTKECCQSGTTNAAYFTAAYCSALHDPDFPESITTIKNMWNSTSQSGFAVYLCAVVT